MTDWEPSASDVQWITNIVDILREGGTWGVPGTGSVFTFYHSKKKFKFMGDRCHETTQRTFKVLTGLGWSEISSF